MSNTDVHNFENKRYCNNSRKLIRTNQAVKVMHPSHAVTSNPQWKSKMPAQVMEECESNTCLTLLIEGGAQNKES
jgi:hypothetical protein